MEFDDRLFIWFEAKLRGAQMPHGQRLFLQRQRDAIASTGRMAVVLVLEHDTQPEEDIDVANCRVRELRHNGEWRPPQNRDLTCREAMDILYAMAGL